VCRHAGGAIKLIQPGDVMGSVPPSAAAWDQMSLLHALARLLDLTATA
jgi:hypothetical protein